MGYSFRGMRRSTLSFSLAGVALTIALTALMMQTAASAQGGRGAPPPPEPQHGHPSGQLVIWGDTALFDGRLNPENCILMSRFKRGMRMGFRMTAIDGGTGQTENTATITGHLTYTSRTKGKLTIDFPMRWRGGEIRETWAPGYLRRPVELG